MIDIVVIILSFICTACIFIAIGITIVLAIYYVSLLAHHLSTNAGKPGKTHR